MTLPYGQGRCFSGSLLSQKFCDKVLNFKYKCPCLLYILYKIYAKNHRICSFPPPISCKIVPNTPIKSVRSSKKRNFPLAKMQSL